MIYGIGVDLVDIGRMARILERWKDRFIERVFTPDEAKMCLKRANPAPSFALRFAAKEACSKAMGLGMRQGVEWKDIEVFHYPEGKPGLRLQGKSLEICRANHITGYHLSLSDDGHYGVAMVVLEQTGETGQSI